ncbi:MAG: FAD binding domain-containing protein [Candidatus Obscuribacterales bacterium]|nr:FAD binding domain-containing protein [Candidatus Obscuribacterales bacterium]
MTLPQFDLYLPETLEKAIELSERFEHACTFLAGGTDLLVNNLDDLDVRKILISLSKVDSLKEMTPTSIGAGVTIADLIRKQDIFPAIIGETARLIAGPALRESATIGGNLLLSGRCIHYNRTKLQRCASGACMKADGEACIAVPQNERCFAPFSGDMAPVLMALNADFVLAGPAGERAVSSCSFFLEDGIQSNVLKPAEILVRISLPADAKELDARYWKLRPRSAVDFPEAGVAVAVKRQAGSLQELRVALGALGPAPKVVHRNGPNVAGQSTQQLADSIWGELSPLVLAVRNTSFAPGYRREMTRLFLGRLLEELLS